MLRDGVSGSNAAQESAYSRLTELSHHEEFDLYLAFVLNAGMPEFGPELSAVVRQTAGLVLKNNLRRSYAAHSSEARNYIHTELLIAVGDALEPIRIAASIAISVIVGKSGLQAWPELLPSLTTYLRSDDDSYVKGAVSSLCKICEDSMDWFESDPDDPLEKIVPQLMEFIRHKDDDVRVQVIHCLNQLLLLMPDAIKNNLQQIVQVLFIAANDQNEKVRQGFCGATCKLLESAPESLEPHMNDIIVYMIETSNSNSEELALEACEFWSTYPDKPGAKRRLQEYLQQIILVLLKNMVYKEGDPEVFDSEEDCTVPDRVEEVRPRFHNPRSRNISDGAPINSLVDDDEGEAAGETSLWTVRKSSAAGLDILSTLYGDDLLPWLLPVVQERLGEGQQWQIRESAILTLGAISEGCFNGIMRYLPILVPHLLQTLRDPHRLVRSMSCWTLSRYSRWIITDRSLSQRVVQALLVAVLDRNKRVQSSACSALASFEEDIGPDLESMLEQLLQTFAEAFQLYQRKNQLILYDAIGTMAESVGPALGKPELLTVLMPPLISKWNELSNSDVDLLPLLECLAVVLKVIGRKSFAYAHHVSARCLHIVQRSFSNMESEDDALDAEFVICSLDLISGITEANGAAVEQILDTSELLRLLMIALRKSRADIRQSAFALLGDLVRARVTGIASMVKTCMSLIAAGLEIRFSNVSNNATWVLGEIAMMVYSSRKCIG